MNFPINRKIRKRINNYELYLLPRGVYFAKEIDISNYLFPLYYFFENDLYVVSTSVYELIKYKRKFIRNVNFHTTDFYRPTFQTVDQEIFRGRTKHRRSSNELSDPIVIADLSVKIIQNYITEIEDKYPEFVHVLLMGGKDSQNILLCKRKSRWVVITGDPNADLNDKFIKDNKIRIEEFIKVSNISDDSIIDDEIKYSDCFFDISHFRYIAHIKKVSDRFNRKIVIWYGTSGDGCFTRNTNHLHDDYYKVHDLHVGTAMGIWHQLGKNLFDCPVLSPYQCPEFLDKVFYKFDPLYVDKYSGDLRIYIGEKLFGKKVMYPLKNPEPAPWKRKYNRRLAIKKYVHFLKSENIEIKSNLIISIVNKYKEEAVYFLDKHSLKKRTILSKFLYPLRRFLSKFFPRLRKQRYLIKEI